MKLGAICLISIAGEYRYLLPIFELPLVLLHALAEDRRERQRVHPDS